MSRDHPQPFTGRRGRENHLAKDTRAQGGAVAATTADRDDQQRDRERERPGIHGRTGDSYCSRNLNWNCYWRRSRSSESGIQDEHSARKSTGRDGSTDAEQFATDNLEVLWRSSTRHSNGYSNCHSVGGNGNHGLRRFGDGTTLQRLRHRPRPVRATLLPVVHGT